MATTVQTPPTALPPCPATKPELAEAQARRFCQTFVALLGVILVCVATLNLLANPFAQYPVGVLSPIVQMSRVDKLALFEEQSSVPQGLVLGSSRVLKLEPEYLQRKSGLEFFNAGVNYAVPLDHLAWFRHYLSCYGCAPQLVIVGLDISSFSSKVATDARLVGNPTLSRQVRDYLELSDRWAPVTELLAWQQTRESLRSLKHHLLRQTASPPIEEYRPDGLLVYSQREQQVAAGTYDFQGPLEFNKHEYESRYQGFDLLSAQRLSHFEQLAIECDQHGCHLVAFLTPMHPDLFAHLTARTELTMRRAELRQHLQRLADQWNFTFSDVTELESYGGDVTLFVDGIHQLEPNTRKLIDAVLPAEHQMTPRAR